jgi:hypothetical protein
MEGSGMKLADFLNFEKFLAPVLIKIIYWVGLVLLFLSFLASFGAYGAMGLGGGLGFLVSIVGLVLAALAWRVLCEIWIVIFSINDRLGNLSSSTTKPEA